MADSASIHDVDLSELLKDDTDVASNNSSSSIYSSPTNTPIASSNEPISQYSNEQNNHTYTGCEIVRNESHSRKNSYEDLIDATKLQMTNKFDQLEIETGISLKNKDFLTEYTEISLNNTSISNQPNEKMLNLSSNLKSLEYLRMENELKRLKEELNLKNEIVDKMFKIRSQVESELEDLTASLFEEANKMVYKANVLRDKADKELVEATLKIDMLTAEVQALKLLVITSTPSRPNPHLHPQLNSPKKASKQSSQNIPSFPKKSPSNYELGANNDTPVNKDAEIDELNLQDQPTKTCEIDPVFYEEFTDWKKSPTLEPMTSKFMRRIYDEEIYPVFNFKNKDLTSLVLRSIENNSLTVESVNGDKLPFPKKCALMEAPRICHYRMKIEENRWYAISKLCRNRITAVCDLFCYLRYIQNGLVKNSVKEIYWQIMKRRRNISISKLGFLPNA